MTQDIKGKTIKEQLNHWWAYGGGGLQKIIKKIERIEQQNEIRGEAIKDLKALIKRISPKININKAIKELKQNQK